MDKESRDLARRDQRTTPKKKSATPSKRNSTKEEEEEKENMGEEEGNNTASRTRLNFGGSKEATFGHPVYKEISRKNGFLNRQDLSSLKRICKMEGIDSGGKRDLLMKRLKQFYQAKMLKEAGLLEHQHRGFDYLVVVDFEATCEEKNSPDFPHEIIEFPAVLIDVLSCRVVDSWRRYVRPRINPTLSEFCSSLTGISQETVDAAESFPAVLLAFQHWLSHKRLGREHTFALVTDGPFDVGRFLRLSCEQHSLALPDWASRWINLRKAFANFYKSGQGNNPSRAPGLQHMLSKLDLDFLGNPHSGLDDANNIARVAQRLLRDGATLRVNERLDVPGCSHGELGEEDGVGGEEEEGERRNQSKDRRLQFVTAVTQKEAEDWLAKCRNHLDDTSLASLAP